MKPGSEYIDLVLKGGIEIAIPEPPAEMIRNLHIYAADLPGGKEMAKEFITKLCEIKYPELQNAA